LTAAAAAIIIATQGTGCASQTSEEEMNELGSALTKLSASVDSTVRFRNPPADLSSAQLLQLSIAHDPSLTAPFARLELQVQRNGRDSSVLVCRPGGPALLEDAGCTAILDRHHWNSTPPRSCAPTLDLASVCRR
jgi:hypothetical protein